MTTDPNELLTKTLPELVNAAVAEMKGNADRGDAQAKQNYEDLAKSSAAVRIVLEGSGTDVYLVSENANMRAERSAPKAPILFAVAVPAEAAEIAVEELAGELEQALVFLRKRLVRLAPKKTRAALDRIAQEQMRFHLVIKDTPDFAEVRVKVATGSGEPPAQPGFTVTVGYDTFEQLRSRKLKPQAILSKLQLSGDSTRAMQLAMELLQRRGA